MKRRNTRHISAGETAVKNVPQKDEPMQTGRKNRTIYHKIVLAAELYYTYGLSQEEVANRMGVTRPWVSKMLKRAEEMGIVRIEVMSPSAGIVQVEEALCERYGIKKATVIRSTDPQSSLKDLGRAAAHYLISAIRPNDTLGVYWGKTLAAVADEFIPLRHPDVTVVSLVGGFGKNPEILSNQIAGKIANALEAQCILLHAPALTGSREERDIFLKDPMIADAVQAGEKSDIVLLSIGSLWNSTLLDSGYVTEEEVNKLEEEGAVGDLAMRFVDKNGRILSHSVNDRIVAAELEQICTDARHVVGIALGENKVKVIKAAMLGRWIDVLVTDSNTAEELLK